MKLTGAQIFFECLKAEGVDVIFGLPGGVLLDLYDEMPKHDIRHILVRHEQGATHMADGYARATGRVGVCLVTSGPGATNTVTGIATAYMDSIPLVVISGQVQSHLIGEDAFQETDMVGISRPIVKHSFLVQKPEDIPSTIKKAFLLRPRVVPGRWWSCCRGISRRRPSRTLPPPRLREPCRRRPLRRRSAPPWTPSVAPAIRSSSRAR